VNSDRPSFFHSPVTAFTRHYPNRSTQPSSYAESEKDILCPVKTIKSRIMYIECKGNEISGPARIGRVTFSKSGKSLYYKGRRFHTLSGSGFKANYFDWETEEHYWISGCKKRGGDRLYAGTIEIDADVREEYWNEIRGLPNQKDQKLIRCAGKYR